MPRPSSAPFAGACGCGAAKFSYPQTLEKARNGEGISPAVAPVQRNAASDFSGFIPPGCSRPATSRGTSSPTPAPASWNPAQPGEAV